jgi:hypothetical protein
MNFYSIYEYVVTLYNDNLYCQENSAGIHGSMGGQVEAKILSGSKTPPLFFSIDWQGTFPPLLGGIRGVRYITSLEFSGCHLI